MQRISEEMIRQILIVDDEEAIRVILKASLEMTTEWTVLVASSAEAGIQIARARLPDAILLDVRMPGTDGIALFHQLQAHELTHNIPAIFLTAEARLAEHQALEVLGAGVISKPFEPMAIAAQIRALLAWAQDS